MIWTVFPKDDRFLPHDEDTYQKAKEWAEEVLNCEYEIESTEGDVV